MKPTQYLLLISLFIGLASPAWSQKYTISGQLTNANTGEDLIGATVYVEELESGSVSNLYGFYSITLERGTYHLKYSYVGYESISKVINLDSDQRINIQLSTKGEVLQEVQITAEAENENIREVQMSVEKIDIKTVQKLPQLLGETDIIRTIQLRPGVTSVGEGANGFNVRGGNIDQNLILLDEGHVYSSSHLFGFFSVFNPDAVKDMQLYKGGIPARYGGRLSSVMDVRQRDGNSKSFHGQGGLGALSSRLTLEGPIIKDKMSFLVSGRRSYADLFLLLTEDFKETQAFFYDLNAKVNYKISPTDRVFASGYFGRDVFNFGDAFKTDWGNTTGTIRWNHLFSDALFANFTAIYSDYGYGLGIPTGANAFNWSARIQTSRGQGDFTYYLNPKNTLEFGFSGTYYTIDPGTAKGVGETSFFNELVVPRENAWLFEAYLSNDQKIGDRLTLRYGLRYAYFANVGETKLNIYRDGVPTVAEDIIAVEEIGKGELVEDYGGLEPRLALNFAQSDSLSYKLSYMRTRQFIHLVSNTTTATPVDVWKLAGRYVAPAYADQIALGWFKNFKSHTYTIGIEAYYKWMYNLLDYRNGAELLLNDNVETEFLSGTGVSRGLEVTLEKKKGKLTGWIGYTLSRTEATVPGFTTDNYTQDANGINFGEAYPTNWDKTHDLSVVATYSLSQRIDLGAAFIYMTGRPASFPEGRFSFDNIVAPIYRYRNSFRIPPTHRLDLSVTLNPKEKEGNFESSWSFGVYNLYGRNNPYSIYFQPSFDAPTMTEAHQLSIIGIPVPYATWNFKF